MAVEVILHQMCSSAGLSMPQLIISSVKSYKHRFVPSEYLEHEMLLFM